MNPQEDVLYYNTINDYTKIIHHSFQMFPLKYMTQNICIPSAQNVPKHIPVSSCATAKHFQRVSIFRLLLVALVHTS